MQLERLVCSACKGSLEWNAANRVFVCSNCGSVYRRVDEAELDKSEKDLERAKLAYELEREQRRVELERIKAEAKDKERRRETFNGTLIVIVSVIMLIGIFILWQKYLFR